MADKTDLNAQITDAVTQANLLVAGLAPAHAAGMQLQSLAHSIGLSFQNAVSAQHQSVLRGATGSVLETLYLLGPLSLLARGARRTRAPGRLARRP